MHFLLVNDDGIGSAGIMALMEAALKRGHRVSMCAPSGQMSAASHRITLSDPLYVKDYPLNRENAQGFAITGTPADCVRLAFLGGLVTEPVDGVISGVNNGYNAGLAVYYSGTVGAAREAALLGHPSIAASIDYKADPAHVQDAAELVLEVAEKYFRAPKNGFRVLNINVPDLPRAQWKAPMYAPLSDAGIRDGYDRCYADRPGTYFWLQEGCESEPPAEGSDEWYLNEGHPALTLLSGMGSEPQADFDRLGLLG